jgi:hypothetical protein
MEKDYIFLVRQTSHHNYDYICNNRGSCNDGLEDLVFVSEDTVDHRFDYRSDSTTGNLLLLLCLLSSVS